MELSSTDAAGPVGNMAALVAAFRASPLDDVLAAFAASLATQQGVTDELRAAQAQQQERHDTQMREAQKELDALRKALTKSARESESARAEQAEISKRALALQRELLEYQAEDLAALKSRVGELEAKLDNAQAAAETQAKKQRDDASSSNKAQAEQAANQAHHALQNATSAHTSLAANLDSIADTLRAIQRELEEASHEIKSEGKQGGPLFNASQHLGDLLAVSASASGLAPQLTEYGIHIEFAQHQLSWLQRLQIHAPGQATETTLVEGLNKEFSRVLQERTTMLDSIKSLSDMLNMAFVNFQERVLDSAHNKTVHYCESSLAPHIRRELLARVEGLISEQTKSIVEATTQRTEETNRPKSQTKSKRKKQKDRDKRRKATVPNGNNNTKNESVFQSSGSCASNAAIGQAESVATTGKKDVCVEELEHVEKSGEDHKNRTHNKNDDEQDTHDDHAETDDDYATESSDLEGQEREDRGSRALRETERLASKLQDLSKSISSDIESAVTKVRNQTTSTQENVKGIFVRIGDIETKNEVLDNAVAAIRFTMDSMKLWKQDLHSEIEKIRVSMPETPKPYDDSQLQEKLEDLARNATASMLQLRNIHESKGKHEELVKAALEEQASAIAHLVASKADQKMVEEGLNSKADSALEGGIREFMKRVALDIDDRDYRSGKIACSERAQLETRILRMVTSSLRRIRRQQAMLSKALPQGLGGQTAMAGIVYKCLACERPSPPSILDPTNQSFSSIYSGGSGLLESSLLVPDGSSPHDYDPRARTTHPYTSSTGSLTMRRPVTAPHVHGVKSFTNSASLDLSADPAQQARRNVHTYSPYKVKGAGFRVTNKNR